MATIRIIPMHINKGKSAAQCLKARISYVLNPKKTEDGRLVSSYACAPETADQEFLLGRNAYIANTGRRIGNEVIAYQIRQSFKPGEVTAEEANQIGYELATQILNGDFSFLVATHTDHAHVHNHIVFSAVSLDSTRKFQNVFWSSRRVSKLSDQICSEHHLSVIQEPKGKALTYDKWQGNQARISNRDTLRMMLDAALRTQPDAFDALMRLLEEAGCRIQYGTAISILPPEGKRYIRLDTLGAEYTESALNASLEGLHIHIPQIPRNQYTSKHVSLMLNIEKKMCEGKGRGYRIWAERHNLDAISKSVIYLKENHIASYDDLNTQILAKSEERTHLKKQIKAVQNRMKEISEQKKAILTYRRTKDVYVQYRMSGWSQTFYQEHAKEIEAHHTAQKVYTKFGGKPPKLDELSTEYDRLLEQKRTDSATLSAIKTEVSNLYHIKTNLELLADDTPTEQKPEQHIDRNLR